MVDRCVCHQVLLSRVKARADGLRAAGITGENQLVEALADELGCTTGCGMCEPYVRLTLRTGRVGFDHREAAVRAAIAGR
jgi:NAD(P)H-nitrite reductase large subunit